MRQWPGGHFTRHKAFFRLHKVSDLQARATHVSGSALAHRKSGWWSEDRCAGFAETYTSDPDSVEVELSPHQPRRPCNHRLDLLRSLLTRGARPSEEGSVLLVVPAAAAAVILSGGAPPVCFSNLPKVQQCRGGSEGQGACGSPTRESVLLLELRGQGDKYSSTHSPLIERGRVESGTGAGSGWRWTMRREECACLCNSG